MRKSKSLKQIHMKIKKILGSFVIVLLLASCTANEELDFLEESSDGRMNECLLDCEIDDGGPGGGTLPEFSNYFYVHKGQTNSNIYFANSNDGTNWTTSQLGLGAKSSKGPTSVLFDNKRFIFYKGNSSSNIFFAYKTQLSNTWYGNTFINNVSKTSRSISSVVFDNKIFIAYKGETNGNLYFAYSSAGTVGNYTEVVALPSGNGVVEYFTIATNGNKMYLFWSSRYYDPTIGNYRELIYYRSTTNPTNSNSWSSTTLLEDSLGTLTFESGISATSLNGDLYIALGDVNINLNGTPIRYLSIGKLTSNDVWSKTTTPYTFADRAGIMGTDNSKLLVSYKGHYAGDIKTMKVNLDGTIDTTPYNSGGATNIGGVFSHSKFN